MAKDQMKTNNQNALIYLLWTGSSGFSYGFMSECANNDRGKLTNKPFRKLIYLLACTSTHDYIITNIT